MINDDDLTPYYNCDTLTAVKNYEYFNKILREVKLFYPIEDLKQHPLLPQTDSQSDISISLDGE